MSRVRRTVDGAASVVCWGLLVAGVGVLLAKFAVAAVVYPFGAAIVVAVVAVLGVFAWWWPTPPGAAELEAAQERENGGI
jgi:hypothetical protein